NLRLRKVLISTCRADRLTWVPARQVSIAPAVVEYSDDQAGVAGTRQRIGASSQTVKLTETGEWSRSAEITSRPQMLINLPIVFSCFRDVSLVSGFGDSPQE